MRDGEAIQAYADFQQTIKAERLARLISAATEIVAAQRKARHEGCKDGACGEGGGTEDELQLANPDYLVN